MNETEEITQWVTKEENYLRNSVFRLALLATIKQYQDEGIYGYLIGEKLINTTDGKLDGTNAMFYAILRRFEKEKLIVPETRLSSSGPVRKHYRLTPKGERAYQALWQNWMYYYQILENLIQLNGETSWI